MVWVTVRGRGRIRYGMGEGEGQSSGARKLVVAGVGAGYFAQFHYEA